MRVGFVYAYMDNQRRGKKYRGPIQPITGALVAALLPQRPDLEVEVINDNSPREVDWSRDYDLLFLSSIHSDFDRARQISHYWRRRGAKTVYGGFMASTYPHLCQPFFDAVVVGDAEGCTARIFEDFCRGELESLYLSSPFDAEAVPVPRLDLLAERNLVPLTFEITRGCPFQCDFCALTGIGTRFHTRPIEAVLEEIRQARDRVRSRVPWYKRIYDRRAACFVDNNFGGNPRYMRELCRALEPLRLIWGTQATFNVLAEEDNVRALSRAGCRAVFVGLESLSSETLSDMNKSQNSLEDTREVIDRCHRHGIVLGSGLLLSPVTDDLEYIHSLPERLDECGLVLPAYTCFESPIPGTPHFHRLAEEEEPALLPGALLRDFSGYTLVTRPRRETPEDFVDGYTWLLRQIYAPRRKLTRFARFLPGYVAGGWWSSIVFEVANYLSAGAPADPGRTYLAGTDRRPPEEDGVPWSDDDFDSEQERRTVLEPWRVTDESGRILPTWLRSTPVYRSTGGMATSVERLSPTLRDGFDGSVVTGVPA